MTKIFLKTVYDLVAFQAANRLYEFGLSTDTTAKTLYETAMRVSR